MKRNPPTCCGKPMQRKKAEDGDWGWICYSHTYLMPVGSEMKPTAKGRWVTDKYLDELERETARP